MFADFSSFIGNDVVKSQLNIALHSARKRNRSLPHMLFSGVAGCGKTTLAKLTASIGTMDFIQVAPQEIKDYKSALEIFKNVNHRGYNTKGDVVDKITPTIVFMDEIHRLPIVGQEKLGIIMEEFRIESERDKGSYVWFPLFTIIGATTEEGLLSKPFRERFKLILSFKVYTLQDMINIISYHSKQKGLVITPKAIREIARRSRGVPRIGIRNLERVQDLSIEYGSEIITSNVVLNTFKLMDIDDEGLTAQERKILVSLYNSSVPVGLESLAVSSNISKTTLSDSTEPFLIQKGLIARSGRGRILTKEGINYVKNMLDENKMVIKKQEIEATYVRKL